MTVGVHEKYDPNGQHPVEYLFDELAGFDYPDGVVPVPKRIPGTAFFPGGSGLWRERPNGPLPPMPIGKVMVLGNYFDSQKGYRKSLQMGNELHTPTWNSLRPLLGSAGIRLRNCFFTNVYMGLSVGDESNMGPSPGAKDPEFRGRCESFLVTQIAVQKPQLILVLGGVAREFITSQSSDLAAWTRCESFPKLDDSGPVKCGVRFHDSQGQAGPATVVVALVHPCMRGSNLRWRRYRGSTKNDAELAMLRDALEAVRTSE